MQSISSEIEIFLKEQVGARKKAIVFLINGSGRKWVNYGQLVVKLINWTFIKGTSGPKGRKKAKFFFRKFLIDGSGRKWD